MSSDNEPFGARLYDELRKISGYSVVSSLLDYQSIQQLKQADRDAALALFSISDKKLLQQLRTMEPESLARFFVESAKYANDNTNAMLVVALNLLSNSD